MAVARGYKFDVLETKASETLEHQTHGLASTLIL